MNTSEHYNIISLGGGLQSTTMLLCSLHGVIEKPDCAVFADTGWERDSTYKNVEMLRDYADQFDVPVVTVKGYTSVRKQALDPEYGFVHIPFYQESTNGKYKQQVKKQCTNHFKIQPIKKYLRDTYGKKATFSQWIGISTDEALRQKPSKFKFIKNRYPLIEMRWGRGHCIEWLKTNGFSVPSKSSCVGCPLHSNEVWLDLTNDERHDAIDLDEKIRDTNATSTKVMQSKPTHQDQIEAFNIEHYDKINYDPAKLIQIKEMKAYLHSSRRPLKEFYDSPADYPKELFDMESEECTGMCFT